MSSVLKRSFDVAFALCLGVLLSPVILVIAAALKITSPGPLLFRQKRLGKGGATFMMNKFRKFPSDWGNQGPGVTLQFDSRMTTVGRVLERTKLDELPQLWNIILGEMSFVGPRPESLRFQHLFTGRFSNVLDYTPGIFGPNQTKYRNESAMYPADEDPHTFYERVLFPDKASNDLAYFEQSNFLSDLWCIVNGVFALVFSAVIWRKSMKTSAVLFGWDVLAFLAAWATTHWLKYSVVSRSTISPAVVEVFKAGFLITPLVVFVVFAVARIYRNPVRYFSGTDFYRLVGASCAVWIISAIAFGILLDSTSSLLLAVSGLVSVSLLALPRVLYREWHQAANHGGPGVRKMSDQVNIAVCGVTPQSIALCNLLKSGYRKANVVGIIGDDTEQLRREVHGFQVIGLPSDLDVLGTRYNLHQLWIADTLEEDELVKIKSWCDVNHIERLTLSDLPGFCLLAPEAGTTKQGFQSESPPKPGRSDVGHKASSEVAA